MMFSTETKLRAEIEQVWMILRAERVTITAQAERIRVLREVVESAAAADAFLADAGCRERLAAMARAALEASNE